MFGSLILPTTTTTGTRIPARRRRDHLSSIPNTTNYHLVPTSSKRRIRASSSSSFTSTAASSDTTTTLPTTTTRVDLISSKPQDLYQILRIQQNASSLEIKTAYRKLAKQFHPDALPPPPPTTSSSSSESDAGGARDFMAIHNAYATLSDPAERARYDLSIQIHTRRFHSYYSSSSSSSTAVDGNEDRWRRSYGMPTTRRWETDQCW